MLEERVKELIKHDLNNKKIYLDKIKYLKEDGNNYLRIYIYKDGLMDIDTCVEASNIINIILDKEDLIKDSYILDICSKESGDNNEQ